MAEKVEDLVLAAFERFDGDKDGTITREDLTNVLRSLNPDVFDSSTVDSMLKEMDLNKDGVVQYSEFVKWVMGGEETPKFRPLDKRGDFDVDYRTFMPEISGHDISERYKLDSKQIGEGGYGKVFIAVDRTFSNNKVAVKKVTRTGSRHDPHQQQLLDTEIKTMKELDHPNICKLLSTYRQGPHMYFVMELCEGGELFDRIVENGLLSEGSAAKIVGQCASAVAYAHARKIAHRDIKPENVVFCTKTPGDFDVKLIDWGLAMSFQGVQMTSAVGSFTYAAPEVIDADTLGAYKETCDLWSIGVLTYVMVSGKPPFWGSRKEFTRSQRREKYPMEGKPWDTMSADGKDFIRQLLRCDPTARMDAEAMQQHPWITSNVEVTEVKLDDENAKLVCQNLKKFSNAGTFARLCVAAVARQLDHRKLGDIHDTFRQLDSNGDGTLSFAEVQSGFKRIYGESSVEYLTAADLFENLDLDDSQSIDYTEFCAAALDQSVLQKDEVLWMAFKTFTGDSAEGITVEKLTKLLDTADVTNSWTVEVCSAAAKEIVAEFDQDKDALINFEDWKKLMSRCWEREQTEDASPDAVLRRNVSVGAGSMNTYDFLTKVTESTDVK